MKNKLQTHEASFSNLEVDAARICKVKEDQKRNRLNQLFITKQQVIAR